MVDGFHGASGLPKGSRARHRELGAVPIASEYRYLLKQQHAVRAGDSVLPLNRQSVCLSPPPPYRWLLTQSAFSPSSMSSSPAGSGRGGRRSSPDWWARGWSWRLVLGSASTPLAWGYPTAAPWRPGE